MRRLDSREIALLWRALRAVAWVRKSLWLHRLHAVRTEIAAMPVQRPASPAEMRDVAWSVGAAARLVPSATCLTQALSGQFLLARRGKRSVVEISVPADGPHFRPHAWLLCGDTILLGGTSARRRTHRTLARYEADGGISRPVQAQGCSMSSVADEAGHEASNPRPIGSAR